MNEIPSCVKLRAHEKKSPNTTVHSGAQGRPCRPVPSGDTLGADTSSVTEYSSHIKISAVDTQTCHLLIGSTPHFVPLGAVPSGNIAGARVAGSRKKSSCKNICVDRRKS